MSNLVQKVNFQLPGSPEIEMYMYGEATLEANQEMQPVLEKLYKYEKQPGIREKIKEYIDELSVEIKRLEGELIEMSGSDPSIVSGTEIKLETLVNIKNDLLGRLEEVI